MKKLRITPAILSGVLVALATITAFCLRVSLSFGEIFKGDWIKYSSADAYYNMRLVDITANNFPSITTFDPYNIFPGGSMISGSNLFIRLIAGIASFFGITSPDQTAIDVVGVFMPPILAALTVILVFFIGREIIGRWGGVLSAFMVAILPGELFSRTKLGFTDYHCFEIFLTTLFILFLVLAVKAARKNELGLSDFIKRNWLTIRKPVIYSLLAGFTLAMYVFAWRGAYLFVFVAFTFFIVQFIADHLRKRDTAYLMITGVVMFVIALIFILPAGVSGSMIMSVVIALLACICLWGVSWLMNRRDMKPWYFPLAVLLLGGAGFGLLSLIFPSIMSTMRQLLVLFVPTGASLTTIEMQPLISGQYSNPFLIVWNNYNTTFFLAFASLWLLIRSLVRKDVPGKNLLLVWSVIMLIANLAQRRFGYYYGINVALLMGLLAWWVIDFARSKIFTEPLLLAYNHAKEAKAKGIRVKHEPSLVAPYFSLTIVVVVVFFAGYFWSIEPVVDAGERVPFAPSDAWCSSLEWMKDNTPDPFGDAEAYYGLYDAEDYTSYSTMLKRLPEGADPEPDFYLTEDGYFPYPDSAYGVLSWWDYGYWISRIAHRIPNANPGQDPRAIKDVASFLLAQDEDSANEVADRLQSDYIVLDYETAWVSPTTAEGKYWAIATWLDQPVSDYFDVYFVANDENATEFHQQILFYPEYFRSMAVRLYNFNAQEYIPETVWVIGWVERNDQAGNTVKLVNYAKSFDTYAEAEEYIDSQEEGDFRVISPDPMISCVPLEALEEYQVIYESEQAVSLTSANMTSSVKVFEHVK